MSKYPMWRGKKFWETLNTPENLKNTKPKQFFLEHKAETGSAWSFSHRGRAFFATAQAYRPHREKDSIKAHHHLEQNNRSRTRTWRQRASAMCTVPRPLIDLLLRAHHVRRGFPNSSSYSPDERRACDPLPCNARACMPTCEKYVWLWFVHWMKCTPQIARIPKLSPYGGHPDMVCCSWCQWGET
jgi:hypothetical protein